ncbi:MAG TPA: ATP-binding protein [Terriglobales bacterium]|nr:ATP-binding protein [Terriglobales bacterium]
MRLRLKTKLVIAISAMVVALVSALSYIYVSQLLRQRIQDAYDSADFMSHQILNQAREALEVDYSNLRPDPDNPNAEREAIEESLQTDPGLNSLLQSIVGYDPTIYDAAIVDTQGRALLHTDAAMQGKPVSGFEDMGKILRGGFRQQIRVVYGPHRVYEVRLPLKRDNEPFGSIRVSVDTAFLKAQLEPQLNRTFGFAGISILVSLLLAAALSNFALRPLEAIGKRLDRMTAGEIDAAGPESPVVRSDEYGVVTHKIDRLGRQIRDVKEVFSALKENLDQIMATLQDGLMLFTHDGRVVLVSASAERFVGRPRGEMLGHMADEVFHSASQLDRLVMDAFFLHQPIAQQEIETEQGRRVQVSLDFIAEEGQPIGALLTMRDAESVRRIENEIELSRRLAAIGRLTSGVAHEVKNPINAIVVHLEILREKLQQIDPDSRRHMDIIGNEIQRLDRVVKTLVDFTRPVELRLSDLDLRQTLREVTDLAAPDAARHGVTIDMELGDDPLPVRVDIDLVKQAVLNIVINGVQAMAGGGTLGVKARRGRNAALVEIADQGPGIPPEIRDKVFNLYFTTKEKGSGIGLAMTYRVMQLHNGSIEFDSEPGGGTTFRLQLPLVEARSDTPAQEAAARS